MIESNESLIKLPCTVCIESLDATQPLAEDKGMFIVQCTNCGVQCHWRCRGTDNPLSGLNEFLCDPCSNKAKTHHCDICLGAQGYMTQYKTRRYVHLYCALFSDAFVIEDLGSMKLSSITALDKLLKSSTAKKAPACFICKKRGGLMMKCSSDACDKHIHLFCARLLQYNTKQTYPDSNDHWAVKIAPNQEYATTKVEDVLSKEEALELMDQRSGSIIVLCPEHIGPIEYCSCKSSSAADDMICCDYCDIWFHMKCLNMAETNVSKYNNDTWYCQPCTRWFLLKKNSLAEEDSTSAQAIDQMPHSGWNTRILPQLYIYKISDLIFMGAQFIKRVNTVINTPCALSAFTEVLLTGKSLPFCFEANAVRDPLNEKMSNYKSISSTQELNALIEQLNAYLSSDMIDDISVTQLNDLNSLSNEINQSSKQQEEQYMSIGFIMQSSSSLIEAKNKLKWCITALNLLIKAAASSNNKCSIEAVRDLQRQVPSKEPFIAYLNTNLLQISSEYDNWLNEVKSFLIAHTENSNQLDKYDKEINQQIKREKSLIAKLLIKRDKILSHLSIKIQRATIEQLLSYGRDLAVDASSEMSSLENDCLKPLRELIEQINRRSISLNEAKELLKKMVSGTIVCDERLKEFNEDYFKAKKWEYTAKEILSEKRVDSLQEHIEAFDDIQFISDEALNSLRMELCDFRDKMATLKEQCIAKLATVNDVKELEGVKELLKKNNAHGDMLKDIEEKITYLNHMGNIFKLKSYAKKDIEALRESLVKYGLINDSLSVEINNRLSLIDNCDNQIKEQLLLPLIPVQSANDTSSDFGLEEMKNILHQLKQNSVLIDNSSILETCMSLWKLNDEFEVNSSLNRINVDEEHLSIFIKKHPDLVNPSLYSRFNLKITELKRKILFAKGSMLLSSKNNEDDKHKLRLDDLKIFFEEENDLKAVQAEMPEEKRNELRDALLVIRQWANNYNELHNEVYVNCVEDKDKCAEVLFSLKATTDAVREYVDLSTQLSLFDEIELLLKLNEEVLGYIALNRNEVSENKPLISQLKAAYEEYIQRVRGGVPLKSLLLMKEEIIKAEAWLERFAEYQSKKRKRFFEQIDLAALETMLNEAKSFLCRVDTEQQTITSDLNATKNFYSVSKSIISPIDPFSYENTQLSANSLEQLNQIIADLNANKVLISDKSLIDTVRTIDWCIKIKSAMSSQVEYHTINRLYQDGLLLKQYPEIKRESYMQKILSQITLAKNFKELADLITKAKQKPISQEEFDSIISEYTDKCRIVFIEEKETIDSIIRLRREYESLFDAYFKAKAGLQDYQKLFNDIIKFPVRLEGLLAKIDDVLVVTKLLQREVKKLYETKVKNKLQLTQDKVYALVEKCRNHSASFPEGEQLIKAYTTLINNLTKLKQMIQDPHSDLYEMISLKEDITIHFNNEDENEINRVIWKRKYQELIVNSRPTQLMIDHLLREVKETGIAFGQEDGEMLTSLRQLHEHGEQFLERIGQCCSVSELNSLKSEISLNCKVDLNQFIVEHETKLNMKLFPTKAFMNQKKKNEASSSHDIAKPALNIVRDDTSLPEKIKLVTTDLATSTNAIGFRSKRNVKRKINSDYEYEKDFIDDFENKIAVRTQQEDLTEPEKAKESGMSGSESLNATPLIQSKPNIEEDADKKQTEKQKQQTDINARIEHLLLNKKTKRSTTTSNQISTTVSQSDQLKLSIQKNTVLQFENICRENPVFNKEGRGFISSLSKKLEEELALAYPKIDAEYQRVLSNMLKTVKELEKFKKVSVLVVKGKVTLFKVAKFPYGLKYIQKLQGIEDSVKNKQRAKEEESIHTLFTGVNELYSSLSVPLKPKEEHKERLVSLNASLAQDDEEDDNGSLKSLSEKEKIRFSPSGGLSKNKALTTSTTIQSSLSPQKQSSIDKNDKLYDPFNNEDMFEPFSHKKKHFFPLFYDPERKKLIKEVIHPDIAKKVPENSILRIWNGKLVINKAELANVSFLSTNQYELFEQFPQFSNEIVISNRAKTNEVIPYVEKQLGNKQKHVLYGWLEIEANNTERYTALAEEYDKNDRCACLIILGIKLYIFALSQKYQKFNKRFRSDCYFYNDVLMSQMDKLLVFVLIANKTDLVDAGKRIAPVVLRRKEITMSQENDNMSPITSEEGGDKEEREEEQEEDYDRKLDRLLETNDLKLLDEYLTSHFGNLSDSDIVEKLMAFDEERRAKLLTLITQYQMNTSASLGKSSDNNQYAMQERRMEVDEDMSQGGNSQSVQQVQQRFEEMINEGQKRRMSQLNQMQQQSSNQPLIPPYYNPSMLPSNPSMFPMMNEYNPMLLQPQPQPQRQYPHQPKRQPQHNYPMHQRYGTNK